MSDRAKIRLALLALFLYFVGLPLLLADSRALAPTRLAPLEETLRVYLEDFDANGKLDNQDAIALLLFGHREPHSNQCDYNKDGVFNIKDVVQLLVNIQKHQWTPLYIPEEPPDTLPTPQDTTAPDTTVPTDTTGTDTTSTVVLYQVKGVVYCASSRVQGMDVYLEGKVDGKDIKMTMKSDANGNFVFQVPPGSYLVYAVDGLGFGYGFTPVSKLLQVINADERVNFFAYEINPDQ